MQPRARLELIRKVENLISDGGGAPLPLVDACRLAGVSVRWFRKWQGVLFSDGLGALKDAPRPGRPRTVEVSEADALKLRERYLKSNRGVNVGSMTLSARSLAKEGALAPEVCEAILAPRSSKHTLPRAVTEAMRTPKAVVARYRDSRDGQNNGIYAPGWLRMSEDGKRRLRAGERQVWDDASVNVGICVPWPRGGDKCSDRFGVRVARYQLLLGLDCATDHVVGYSFVCRPSDAYGAGDVVRALHGVWQREGFAPSQIVLEGGSWQAQRTLSFLEEAGVKVISAKGRPNQKLVENYFNRLWSVMSIKLPARGQVGRFRGEMHEDQLLWQRVRAGALDPRGVFPTYEEVLEALDASIAYLEEEVVESRLYGIWRPAEAWRSALGSDGRECWAGKNGVKMPQDLWRHALPEVAACTVRRGGTVKVRAVSPFGMPWDYLFAWEEGYRYDGQRVVVRFDPWNIGAGAVVETAEGGRVLTEEARCMSPAPDLTAARGFTDPRAEERRLKAESRATVLETVRSFDERAQKPAQRHTARGTSPTVDVLAYWSGKAAHVEEDDEAATAVRRANGSAERATDWAALEAEAGIFTGA